MPPKKKIVPAVSTHIPLVYRHFEPNKAGKLRSVKRAPKAHSASSSTAFTVKKGKNATPTFTQPTLQPAPDILSYDDAGYEGAFDEGAFAETPTVDNTSNDNKASPNQQLRAWRQDFLQAYLEALYGRRAPPKKESSCSECHSQAPCLYQCSSCFLGLSLCQTCMLKAHRQHPLHRIQLWNGHFWADSSLEELGLVLHLGHSGERCPMSKSNAPILVGDLYGFTSVQVSYCSHPDAPSKPIQLLKSGLFPCSDKNPRSAFTLEVLDHFSVCSTLAKISAHRYFAVLKRLTQTGFPASVPNRYRELIMTHRKYAILSAEMRSGACFPPHPNKAYEDSLAIRCVACPNPGVNFDRAEVPLAELIAKKVDKDDICLTDGKMYFVLQDLYREWLTANKAKDNDRGGARPECDNHKAANDKFVRWGGLDVTGVGAYTCARHSLFLPSGLVEFHKGERFCNGDYAFGSVVNYLLRHGDLAFGMTYDIWCHWIPKLQERAAKFPSHIALPKDLKLTGGLPKFHELGHTNRCSVLYSLNYKPYVGRIEGEGPERAWAFLNETSGSTSEKSPGARWDSINMIVGDWNYEKMVNMGSYLAGKFVEATKMYPRQLHVFQELDRSLPREKTDEWKSMSTEPTQDSKGQWTSPFFGTDDWGQTIQEVIKDEEAKEKARENSDQASARPGVARWISKAIEIENTMYKLRIDVNSLGTNATPGQHNKINERRVLLKTRVNTHREEREKFMGSLGDPDHPERPPVASPDPEHAELGLPSSYLPNSISVDESRSLAELEGRVRRAACTSALKSVKNLLGAKALAITYKRRNVTGEIATTRAESALLDLFLQVEHARQRYLRSWSALCRLGLSESDKVTFQELRKEDLKLLTQYLEDDSRGLGQGYMAVPWFWRTVGAENDEEWQIEALRVEWFRARQRYLQWEEELKILKREMVMTWRSFKCHQERWDFKARQDGLHLGMAQYAAKRAYFFSKLAQDVFTRCNKHIINPIVELKWANANWVGETN